MKIRFACVLICSVFGLSPIVVAQTIDSQAFIVPNGTDLEIAGEARYFNAAGERTTVAMSGNLAAYEYVLGSSSEMLTNYTWATDSGAWSDTFHETADEGWCYYAAINAVVRWWSDGTTTESSGRSEDHCVPTSSNPPHGGGVICTMGVDAPPGGQPCTPIIVNVETATYRLSSVDDPVSFDINADGVAERINWTARGTTVAFLALDRNGNGTIDDGSELFGNATPLSVGGRASNGFVALNDLDTNHDGMLDSDDVAWPRLLLWTDADHDGFSQSNELSPVARIVQEIDTHGRWTGRRDSDGNLFGYQGVARLDHATRAIWDVFLRSAD